MRKAMSGGKCYMAYFLVIVFNTSFPYTVIVQDIAQGYNSKRKITYICTLGETGDK